MTEHTFEVTYTKDDDTKVLRITSRNARGGSVGDVVALSPGEKAEITIDNPAGMQLTILEKDATVVHDTTVDDTGEA